MSIRRRMTAMLVGTLLILLGTAGLGLYIYIRDALTRQFDDGLVLKARMLGGLLRASDSGKVEFDFSDNAMPEFGASAAPEYFELWESDGRVAERSKSLKAHDLKLPALAAKGPQYGDMPLPDGRPGRAVKLSVQPNQEEGEWHRSRATHQMRTYVLAVATERAGLDHTLTTIEIGGAMGVGMLALAFGVLVPWLIGRNLRPLETIAAQANQIDASVLGTRFPVELLPHELQPISARLNDLLDRLQGAFERERRFSADVAHELRTPIAELRLLAEVALRFPKDSVETCRSFRDALDIAKQMEVIVETLLEMMRSDAGLTPQLQSTDLPSLARQSWRVFEQHAADKNVSLVISGGEMPSVDTDPSVMGQIFSNLLSNALEYSPARSDIEWKQESHPDRIVVTLSNATTNLEAGDLSHLAEPFWRKDASRTGHSHAGLGLALVACYAKRLNIKVHLALPQPGKFQVALELPR